MPLTLSEQIASSLRQEKKTSEFAKIEINSTELKVDSQLVGQLAGLGICVHFERREYFARQKCDLTKAPQTCSLQFSEIKPNRWIFSECPLADKNGFFNKQNKL